MAWTGYVALMFGLCFIERDGPGKYWSFVLSKKKNVEDAEDVEDATPNKNLGYTTRPILLS